MAPEPTFGRGQELCLLVQKCLPLPEQGLSAELLHPIHEMCSDVFPEPSCGYQVYEVPYYTKALECNLLCTVGQGQASGLQWRYHVKHSDM